jgi:putative spermidine/putrescine transport system ATP-binding protein
VPKKGGTEEAGLELDSVTYRYGPTTALDRLDLSVSTGEFVSILGPSGCGKTTALRVIAGLLRPTSGRVRLDGRDITNLRPEKRPLSMVFQHLALFPHLSVEENVGFSLSIRHTPRMVIRSKVEAMLELVGLSGLGSRSINQLSGGQQQRVALARGLITEPEILLLDEPLGALDLQIRKEMQLELKSLQRRLGITFLFVTHDQTEAMSMSDRVVLMKEGRMVQDAPPFETYTHPVDPFAAKFVGDTNLLEGEVAEINGFVRVAVEGGDIVLPAEPGVAVGDPVVVSIRPEHLFITVDGGSTPSLRGEIVAHSFLGHEILFQIQTSVGLLTVRQSADNEPQTERIGEPVSLGYAPERIRLYRLERDEAS